jgi:hypothetical protein
VNELDDVEAHSHAVTFERCNHDAWNEVGIDLAAASSTTQALWSAIAELDQAILNDPRVAEATPAWTDCMTGLNRHYSAIEEPVAEVRRHVQGVLDDFDLGDAESETLAGFREAAGDAQQFERTVFEDDVGCRIESGLEEQISQARTDHESAFVREESALIERYWDAWGSFRES